MAVNYIPKGSHTITPYLLIENVEKLIDFTGTVFKAELLENIPDKSGKTTHASVKIGDSVVMMGKSSPGRRPIPAMIYVYVEDVDKIYQKALEAGATSIMEPADMYYGDRNAGVKDPSGIEWWIATHFEDISEEEMQKRAAEKQQ